MWLYNLLLCHTHLKVHLLDKKAKTFWPLYREQQQSPMELSGQWSKFLKVGFNGYKMLIHLGGSGIKIYFQSDLDIQSKSC